jgi:hypothetical protein
VSTRVLQTIDVAVALGDAPERTLQSYANRVGVAFPEESNRRSGLKVGEALVWKPETDAGPETIRIAPRRRAAPAPPEICGR